MINSMKAEINFLLTKMFTDSEEERPLELYEAAGDLAYALSLLIDALRKSKFVGKFLEPQ